MVSLEKVEVSAITSWIRSMRVTRNVPVPSTSRNGSCSRNSAKVLVRLFDHRWVEERIEGRHSA